MSHRTLIILGGAGFIGHETVTEAVKAGWQVKAVVRRKRKRRRYVKLVPNLYWGMSPNPRSGRTKSEARAC